MSEKKFILVRSPRELIKDNHIGYGWHKIDFSAFETVDDLITQGFSGVNIGRKGNQIRRFFSLKKGDYVVVPVSRAVAIGRVEGTKSYVLDSGIPYSENRVQVDFFKDSEGNVVFIPRDEFTNGLVARLKIRLSNADLSEFEGELGKHLSALDKGEKYTWNSEVDEHENKAAETFKDILLSRLRNGQRISIKGGGYGLEQLVKELLEVQGFEARIEAKNQSSGIDDADVIATRINSLTNDEERLVIQVKHHKGETGKTGIEQLGAYDLGDGYAFQRKVLITSATLSEELKEEAQEQNIVVVDGEALVQWIFDNIDGLSKATRNALGIIQTPSLI